MLNSFFYSLYSFYFITVFLILFSHYHHVPSHLFLLFLIHNSHQSTGRQDCYSMVWTRPTIPTEGTTDLLHTQRPSHLSPKIRLLCLVHSHLFLLHQDSRNFLIPMVVKGCLWSTCSNKTLSERLQAMLPWTVATPKVRCRDWPWFWTWSYRNTFRIRRRIFNLLGKVIAMSLWPGRIGTTVRISVL